MFHFRLQIQRDYAILRLAILTVLGGDLSALGIENIVTFYGSTDVFRTWETQVYFWAYAISIFFLPTILCFAFTLIQSDHDRRIVPPLFIQAIALILLSFFAYPPSGSNLFSLVIFCGFSGFVGDGIAVWTLGRVGSHEQVARLSFRVLADASILRDILVHPRHRDFIGLRRSFEVTDHGFLFRSRRSRRIQCFIELERGGNNETFVNFAYYRMRAYWIEGSEETEETVRFIGSYLRDILSRQTSPIITEDAPISHCDHIVGRVMDEIMGKYSRAQEVTLGKWFALGITIILWAFSAVAALLLWSTLIQGVALVELVSLVGAAFYATIETIRYFNEG